jgi:phage terminase small subunit
MTRSKPAPKGLGGAGKRLWRQVVDEFELNPVEMTLLGQACPLVDQLERLNAQVVAEELVTTGSMGQPAANPLLDAIRKHTDTLNRLFVAMRVPTQGEAEGRAAASLLGQRAAQARWRRDAEEAV